MERERLLNTKAIAKTGSDRMTLKFAMILPFMVAYYVAYVSGFYVISEWIQYSVQSNTVLNSSDKKAPSCVEMNATADENKLYEHVESETARWQMLTNVAQFTTGTISSSILPAYSDSFGRRYIMFLGIAGLLCRFIVCLATIYFDFGPLYIVLSFAIDGAMGSGLSVGSGIFSYIADITEHGRYRSFVMIATDGIVLVCVTLSSFGAGYFIQWKGFFIPMVTCSGLAVVAFLCLALLVPESYPKKMRSKPLSVFTTFKRTFALYVSESFKEQRCAYLVFILAFVFENISNVSRAQMEMVYQLGRPFCWSANKIGDFSALRHMAQGLAGIFLIKPLQACLSDLNIAILSLLFAAVSYVYEAFAYTPLMLYMVPILATFSVICEGMIKSLMSNITPPDKQGSLFASIMVTSGLCALCSNFIFNTVYENTVSFMSGFVFFTMAGSAAISAIILIFYVMFRGGKITRENVIEVTISAPLKGNTQR